MPDLTTTISTIGFPAAMCLWFMIRTETAINNNTKALNEIKEVMVKCKRK